MIRVVISALLVLCVSASGGGADEVGADGCAGQSSATPSYLLNAQVIDLTYSVNGGAPADMPGTGQGEQWQPTASLIGFDPLCRRRGNLRWGENIIEIQAREGTGDTSSFRLSIDAGTNVQMQFQLYVIWNGRLNFRLLALADGLFLAFLDPS